MYEIYSKLPQVLKDNLDELSIKVGYEKGGINYFSGDINQRGIYVYLQPVQRTKYGCSCIMLGETFLCGFKIFIKPLGRQSKKQEEAIYNQLNKTEIINRIVDLYYTQKFNEVIEYIKNIIK